MKEKSEAEQFQKKLDSLSRDIASLKEQRDKLKKKSDAVEKLLSERLEKRNSLIVSYIAEPLGDREVDFKQARYLRLQLEKGNTEELENSILGDVKIMNNSHEEILEDGV